ncbi:MAG: alpha/beta hydrolase, partial [Eubacteriaceae bacterium]|nr:alpha/beta hydrolase [Eubacteriaceae bacterium]
MKPQLSFSERIRKIIDTLRPNRYAVRPYLIRDGKSHPFAVICPGGAYRKVCSYVEGLPFARQLNARGYHAIVVYYRVRKKAKYPAPQEDVKRALREILSRSEEWLLEKEGWSLWGASAGGHLAASLM